MISSRMSAFPFIYPRHISAISSVVERGDSMKRFVGGYISQSVTWWQPGTRPCNTFILSPIFFLLTWKHMMIRHMVRSSFDLYGQQNAACGYPFCKAVAISRFASPRSHMNEIDRRLRRFLAINFRLFLAFHRILTSRRSHATSHVEAIRSYEQSVHGNRMPHACTCTWDFPAMKQAPAALGFLFLSAQPGCDLGILSPWGSSSTGERPMHGTLEQLSEVLLPVTWVLASVAEILGLASNQG